MVIYSFQGTLLQQSVNFQFPWNNQINKWPNKTQLSIKYHVCLMLIYVYSITEKTLQFLITQANQKSIYKNFEKNDVNLGQAKMKLYKGPSTNNFGHT